MFLHSRFVGSCFCLILWFSMSPCSVRFQSRFPLSLFFPVTCPFLSLSFHLLHACWSRLPFISLFFLTIVLLFFVQLYLFFLRACYFINVPFKFPSVLPFSLFVLSCSFLLFHFTCNGPFSSFHFFEFSWHRLMNRQLHPSWGQPSMPFCENPSRKNTLLDIPHGHSKFNPCIREQHGKAWIVKIITTRKWTGMKSSEEIIRIRHYDYGTLYLH